MIPSLRLVSRSSEGDATEDSEPRRSTKIAEHECLTNAIRPEQAQTLRRVARVLPELLDSHPTGDSLARAVQEQVLCGELHVIDHFRDGVRSYTILRRSSNPASRLTRREREVIRLVLQGVPNKVIAYELQLTCSTVATHLRRAMRKLEVESRSELLSRLSNLNRALERTRHD